MRDRQTVSPTVATIAYVAVALAVLLAALAISQLTNEGDALRQQGLSEFVFLATLYGSAHIVTAFMAHIIGRAFEERTRSTIYLGTATLGLVTTLLLYRTEEGLSFQELFVASLFAVALEHWIRVHMLLKRAPL